MTRLFVLTSFLLPLLTAPLSGQVECGLGEGVVSGRVVAPEGQGLSRVVVELRKYQCGTLTDSNGQFAFAGLPGDSVQILATPLGYCVLPQWLSTDASLTDPVVLRAVELHFSEAFFAIHGSPWRPPAFEQLRCQDRLGRALRDDSDVPEEWDLPDPDTVLAWLMRRNDVRELLQEAGGSAADPLPVMFRYGELTQPPPDAPIPYRLDPVGIREGVYMIVMSADATEVVVQVGRPSHRETPRENVYAEHGFKIRWTRSERGWGGGSVVDAWEYQVPEDS